MELNPKMFKEFLPKPVGLITTIDLNGIPNAAPYACIMPILKPLDLVAIASAIPRDTLKNIRETKEFVINVLGKNKFKDAIRCAKTFPPDVNELEVYNIETTSSKKIKPPRMKHAIGWIEAILEKEIAEDKYVLIIGKVVCAELNDEYLKNGTLVESPVILLGNEFKTVGERISLREEFSEELSSIRF